MYIAHYPITGLFSLAILRHVSVTLNFFSASEPGVIVRLSMHVVNASLVAHYVSELFVPYLRARV